MPPADFTLLQVTPALDGGGVESLTVDVAARAAAAGARSLVASRGGKLEPALAAAGARLVRLPLDRRDPMSLALNAGRLARVIRREGVSLVHVRSRAPAFSALWAARRAGIPLVATYHGIYSARSPLKRWYNGVMTRGDAVIANSAFTRDHILAQHSVAPDKVMVIPEGVDTAVFDPAAVSAGRVEAMRAAWGAEPGETVILLAARLADWKGHRLLIAAMARAARSGATRLVFAGPGQESAFAAELSAQARAAGVTLHLAGPCTDMPAAFAAADLIAAPSTLAESFGRSVAEAGAMGRVVIASRLGGPAETILDGDTGWLAPAGDEAAWAAALERAMATSDQARAAMGAAARERICRLYSAERMWGATFDLYQRMSHRGS